MNYKVKNTRIHNTVQIRLYCYAMYSIFKVIIIGIYYNKILDLNVLYNSYKLCRKGVDWKYSTQRFEANLLQISVRKAHSFRGGMDSTFIL